jgi:succinyl-CoA synthetase alpha subunit
LTGRPIVAFVAGEQAPAGKIMGHAGAFTLLDEPSVDDKRRALAGAGVTLVDHPQDFGPALVKMLAAKAINRSIASIAKTVHVQRRQFHDVSHRPSLVSSLTRIFRMPRTVHQRRSICISQSDAFAMLRSQGIKCHAVSSPSQESGSGGRSYLAVGVDRSRRCPALFTSPSNGPGLQSFAVRQGQDAALDMDLSAVARVLAFSPDNTDSLGRLVTVLVDIFYKLEAYLLEVTIGEDRGDITVVSARFAFDDAAFRSCRRQAEIQKMRDTRQDDDLAVAAERHGITYVRLPGKGLIGTLVNGAGLAMNTVDMLCKQGGTVANFLDTGGKATSETVKHSFATILQDKRVRVIFVNIFGGLTMGDMIARGILVAFRELKPTVPVVVRIRGTNEKAGQAIIRKSGLPLFVFDDFYDAANKAIELSRITSMHDTRWPIK